MIHLYSDSRCPFSHRVRLVLCFKGMDFKIIDVSVNLSNDLMLLNPYNETPVLVDDIDKNNKKKDLVLLDSRIICEYIDERFPHPQLMPIEPSEKARLRMLMHHFERELFVHMRILDNSLSQKEVKPKKELEKTKIKITQGLDSISNLFNVDKKALFLFGNSFSLLDAAVLPLVWRLKYYDIPIKETWSGLINYAQTQFAMPEFIASLTPAERGMKIS